MDVARQTLEIVARARWYNQWLFSFIKPHLGGRVLEIGCGIGVFTSMLVRTGKVVAIDIERSYVDKVKSQIKTPNLTAMWGNIEKNEFTSDPGMFDSVVCLNVLEHIEEDERALKNMESRLKTGGRLILLVPAMPLLYGSLDRELGHKRRYKRKDLLQKIQKAGFNVERIRFLNMLGTFGWFVNGKLLQRKVLPSIQTTLFNFFARPFLLIEKIFPSPLGLSLFVIAKK